MRLSELTEDELTPEQHAVLEQIRSGPRAAQARRLGLGGPFGVWVRVPALGGPTQDLGAAVRFHSSLADDVREVAICTTGHFHRAAFEVAAHTRIALEAGVDGAALERLRRDQPPGFTGLQDLAWRVARALLEQHRLDDALYAEARAALGEAALIELVLTVGYYCLVSHTLNAFEIPLAEGMSDPYPPT